MCGICGQIALNRKQVSHEATRLRIGDRMIQAFILTPPPASAWRIAALP